jgi:hypothetical protein
MFQGLKLPVPKAGEFVLGVVDGSGRLVDSLTTTVGDSAAALKRGLDFLRKNAGPQRDALKVLAEAQHEAVQSGRRLWIIEGGPRCGPCFQLARWIDDQHALLDRDYVFVKLIWECDENMSEVLHKFQWPPKAGIPCYAIADAGGTVLAKSEGPMGNIGFPTSPTELHHFRQMLERTAQKLTAGEIDLLMHSLGG